jgi:hypothetical protein
MLIDFFLHVLRETLRFKGATRTPFHQPLDLRYRTLHESPPVDESLRVGSAFDEGAAKPLAVARRPTDVNELEKAETLKHHIDVVTANGTPNADRAVRNAQPPTTKACGPRPHRSDPRTLPSSRERGDGAGAGRDEAGSGRGGRAGPSNRP